MKNITIIKSKNTKIIKIYLMKNIAHVDFFW